MINWINIAKAFGIIAIVMGHSHAPSIVYTFLYYFHIPLFFFIAGYLFNKQQPDFKVFVKNKFKAYMIPYFVYGFIFSILVFMLLFIQNTLTITDIITLTRGYLFGQIDDMANRNLWFLPSLFLTTITGYFLLLNFNLKISIKNNIFFFIILVILIYNLKGIDNYFMSITTLPITLLFFSFGFHYRMFEYADTLNSMTYLLFLLFVTLTMYYISYQYLDQYLDIGQNVIRSNVLILIINALLGIYLIIKVSKFIDKNKFLEYIGELSLYIFMFHQTFVPIINYIYKITAINEVWILTGVLKIVFSIIIYSLVVKPLQKTKYGKII